MIGTYFMAGSGFKSLNSQKNPMYDELNSMLKWVKNSPIFQKTETERFDYGNYIADVDFSPHDEERCHSCLCRVEYYRNKGALYIRIGGHCQFVLNKSDGWEDRFLENLARCAAKCIIGLVSRDVNQVLVHNGTYLSNCQDYCWEGKTFDDEVSVSEFIDQGNTTFAIMGIKKIPNDRVKYQSDADGFIFENPTDYWLAPHNTRKAGITENELGVFSYSTDVEYGLI